jgi:hypothetical protein
MAAVVFAESPPAQNFAVMAAARGRGRGLPAPAKCRDFQVYLEKR